MQSVSDKKKNDIDKVELLKILFKKLLSDNKIDSAERTLFGEFKAVFDIGDRLYSGVLAETIEEIKKSGNIFSGDASLEADSREYKIAVYGEVYYRMLLNGRVSEGENDLLKGLGRVLKIGEEAEGEAVLAAEARIISDASKEVDEKNYAQARTLLFSFSPDKKHYSGYFRAAYKLFKDCPDFGGRAAEEFHDRFLKNAFKGQTPWEALYYYARLEGLRDVERSEKLLLEAFEAADSAEKKHLTYFQMAMANQVSLKFERALEYYMEAEKHLDNDCDTAVNILSCFISVKKFELAESYVAKKYDKFSGDARFLNNCAIVYSKLKNVQKAAELLKKAITSGPRFVDAHVNLINLLIGLKEKPQALEYLKKLEPLDKALYDSLVLKINKTLK